LVRRADLLQVRGLGGMFAYMLEQIGVDRVTRLAAEEPTALHRRLVEFNTRERLTRRAPSWRRLQTGCIERERCRNVSKAPPRALQ
jgi:hypothetical protein